MSMLAVQICQPRVSAAPVSAPAMRLLPQGARLSHCTLYDLRSHDLWKLGVTQIEYTLIFLYLCVLPTSR